MVDQSVSYVVILNAALSILMIVFGWLLNRVFTELDRLRQADDALATKISAFSSQLIDRHMFDQHVEREERALGKLEAHLTLITDSVNSLHLKLAKLNTKE